MARSYGVIKTQVWDAGSEFRALGLPAQWAFAMLVSQPAINNCGALPYQPRKWSKFANGLHEELLMDALVELHDRLFIVVDQETSELLVRTFIKHDRIWKQPNLVVAARREHLTIESELLREVLAAQYPWLNTNTDPKDVKNLPENQATKPLPEPLRKALREPLHLTPFESPSRTPSMRAHAPAYAQPLPLPQRQDRSPSAVSTESSSSRDREAAGEAEQPDDDLLNELDKLNPSKAQRLRWTTTAEQEPDRLQACLTAALKADKPAAYLDDLIKRGQWPTATKPPTAKPPRTPRQKAEAWLRNNGWRFPDPHDFLTTEFNLTENDLQELTDLAADLQRQNKAS